MMVCRSVLMRSPDSDSRRGAAETMFRTPDPTAIPGLDAAIAKETVSSVKTRLEQARASAGQSDAALRDIGSRQVQLLEGRLTRYRKAQEQMEMIRGQIKNVETTMKLLLDTAMTVADPKRVGKDIDEISVSRVAGSSLTSGGFNQAIDAIKSEAA